MTGAPTAVAVLLDVEAQRYDVDPMTGVATEVPRSVGLSAMDEAALEVALRLGETWDVPVTAYAAGPADVEVGLRVALACGAARAVRVACPSDAGAASVAAALCAPLRADDLSLVVAGAHGTDAATGAVPAFVAHGLDAAQALGLVEVEVESSEPGVVIGVRRLDRGARERVRATAPAVVSVEGAAASLRRADLPAILAAADGSIEVVPAAATAATSQHPARSIGVRPFRPRPRVVPAPSGDDARTRISELTGATTPRNPPRTLELDPDEAAAAILDQLAAWGVVVPGDEPES